MRSGRIYNVNPHSSSLGPSECDEGDPLINLVVCGEALERCQFSGPAAGCPCVRDPDPLARPRRLHGSARSPGAHLTCSRTFHSHIKTSLPLILGCGNLDSKLRSLRSR